MRLHTSNGAVVAGAQWVAPASAVDDRVLAGVAGPVLDVGCGQGGTCAPSSNEGSLPSAST